MDAAFSVSRPKLADSSATLNPDPIKHLINTDRHTGPTELVSALGHPWHGPMSDTRRGREVVRCIGRHGTSREQGCADRRDATVAAQTDVNPGGLPIEVFDGTRPECSLVRRSKRQSRWTQRCRKVRGTSLHAAMQLQA